MVEAQLVLNDGGEIPFDDAHSPSIGQPVFGRGSNCVSLLLDDWREFEGAEIEAYRWRINQTSEASVWYDPNFLGTPALYFGYESRLRLRFLRGDCNGDGTTNISDATCILNWLFAGGEAPGCVAATNTNGDEAANITDATYLLNHLFSGGPAPVAPFPDCGPGTLRTDEALGCASPPNCQ